MYRLTCGYEISDIDTGVFFEGHFQSLHGAKIKGTKECKAFGSCNGCITRYVIERVNDKYSVGEIVYKKTIN